MSQEMSPFDFDTIDDFIDSHRSATADRVSDETRLVRSLHGAYALPMASSTAVLDRVQERLRVAISGEPANGQSSRSRARTGQAVMPLSPARPASGRPRGRARSALGAIAAVLMVALLGAAFYAVTLGRDNGRANSHTPTKSASATTGVGPVAAWQDVAISQANTDGKLDFDTAQGVSYSVAATDGSLYACGNGHLWYSSDGGAHYSVFAPALPSSFAASIHGACTMTTVVGRSGVFIAPSSNPSGRSVLYAAPGDSSWQKLIMGGIANSAAGGSTSTTVDGGQLWSDLFQSASLQSLTPAVAGSQGWLFFQTAGGPNSDLVGTNDFGLTWVDISAANTASPCTHFAVAPSNPYILVCQSSAGGGVRETLDGGKTWAPLPEGSVRNLYLVGISPRVVYGVSLGSDSTARLETYDTKGGSTWVEAGLVTAADFLGPVTVTPDDSIYFPTLDSATSAQLAVYSFTPGEKSLRQMMGYQTILGSPKGERSFGGLWPGATPAIYSLLAPATTGPTSIVRAFLPDALATPASPTATVATTPTAIGDTPCTQTPGSPASIQPGGLGADLSTLVTRWGPSDGVAAGTEYYGPITSQGVPEIGVADGYSRVYSLNYTVDRTRKFVQPDATALATTILPSDATPLTPLQPFPAPGGGLKTEMQQLFCSAAYLAVTPTSQQGPLVVPHNGVIRVTYLEGQVGNVYTISFEPVL